MRLIGNDGVIEEDGIFDEDARTVRMVGITVVLGDDAVVGRATVHVDSCTVASVVSVIAEGVVEDIAVDQCPSIAIDTAATSLVTIGLPVIVTFVGVAGYHAVGNRHVVEECHTRAAVALTAAAVVAVYAVVQESQTL